MPNSRNASPRLSIGLPVYNGQRFLEPALACLLAQTFDDFEIIIADNASTDRTPEICESYRRRDLRVRYIRNERNLGAIANFNRVFQLSTAPLFKWAAHDDLYRESYLETCVRLLDEDPDAILAHSNTTFINENGELFPFDHISGCYIDPKTGVRQKADSPDIGDSPVAIRRFRQVLAGARWGTSMFGVVRRKALQQTRLLPNFAGSDRAMLLELALLGRFRSSPDCLFLKRFHAGSSWALSQGELKSFLSTDGRAYWRRARQLHAFFSAPRGKPIGALGKSICAAMLAAHCARIAGQVLMGKERRTAAQGLVWRRQAKATSGSQVTT
jgi:glycosyltransferase involved in cell wall biosynthesis